MSSAELSALLELLGMLFLSPRTGVLMALLLLAAVIDVRSGRIPNWLVFSGIAYAVLYNAFFPLYPRDNGLLFALGGLALGLCAFLPLYALRAMGGGDVKLMAMVGAFVGAWAGLGCVLATALAGGVLAAALTLRAGVTLAYAGGVPAPRRGSAGRIPYAVAIAIGTAAFLVSVQLGLLPQPWSYAA